MVGGCKYCTFKIAWHVWSYRCCVYGSCIVIACSACLWPHTCRIRHVVGLRNTSAVRLDLPDSVKQIPNPTTSPTADHNDSNQHHNRHRHHRHRHRRITKSTFVFLRRRHYITSKYTCENFQKKCTITQTLRVLAKEQNGPMSVSPLIGQPNSLAITQGN